MGPTACTPQQVQVGRLSFCLPLTRTILLTARALCKDDPTTCVVPPFVFSFSFLTYILSTLCAPNMGAYGTPTSEYTTTGLSPPGMSPPFFLHISHFLQPCNPSARREDDHTALRHGEDEDTAVTRSAP